MSTESQNYSLMNQAVAIAEYAASNGYEVVHTYEDAGKSGVTARGRAGLAGLLSDVVGGERTFDAVLVYDVSRWGRYQDPDEAAHYEFMCRGAGVAVKYCVEGFSDDPSGSIMKQLKRIMAGEYSRDLSRKVASGKAHKGTLGYVSGGTCSIAIGRVEIDPDGKALRSLPRGVRKSRPEHSVQHTRGDPMEIAIVRRIFWLTLKKGLRPSEIATSLNARGDPWTDGTPWTNQRVSNVLLCELLTGVEISGKTQRRFGRKAIAQPPEDWIRRPIFQPIISEADFRRAAAMRARPGYHRHRTNAQMLDELRIVVAKHGRVSHSLINKTLGHDKASNFYKRFGSLSNACLLIGQPVKTNGLGRPIGVTISDVELLQALRDLEAKHGHVSTGLLTRDPNMPSPTTYHKRFGSMVAAYEAAGVTSIKAPRTSEQSSL
jgi:DNA invertase Pin-like site-specific DNA recombinase